jgi:lipoate-protein ligase A
MFCINLNTDDPFFNLAIEELLLKNRSGEYLILCINKPSVIIGKHQSAHREVNTRFVNENNIPVIRRISGGGAVFHDGGNLNFSFIRQSEDGKQVDFRKYTRPVIDFLSSLLIDARFEGKNDLKVGGLKISGNAEHIHRNRVLHHGTLLFSASLDIMHSILRKDKSGYTSRAVESNPSSVMNLKEILPGFKDIHAFRAAMADYLLSNMPELIVYNLSQPEIEEAEKLALVKYKTWEWNYAYGPEYSFENNFQTGGISHSLSIFVKDGIIKECRIEGSERLKYAGNKLIGCRHHVADIIKFSRDENILLTLEEVYNFF